MLLTLRGLWPFAQTPRAESAPRPNHSLMKNTSHPAWVVVLISLWLATACGARVALSPRLTLLMFALALVGVFVTPYAYLAHDIASVEHRALLTWAMRLGGGVAIVPISLAVIHALRTAPPPHAGWPARAVPKWIW